MHRGRSRRTPWLGGLLAACATAAPPAPAEATAAPGVVAVRFFDAAGQPLPAAWQATLAAATEWQPAGRSGAAARLGADGRCRLQPGRYALRPRANARAAAPPLAEVLATAAAQTVEAAIPAGTCAVRIALPATTGPGAELQVAHEAGAAYSGPATGEVVLLLPPGPATATVRQRPASGAAPALELTFHVAATAFQEVAWPEQH